MAVPKRSVARIAPSGGGIGVAGSKGARPSLVVSPEDLKRFMDELESMRPELEAALPETISVKRFMSTAVAAVTKNPMLVKAERGSLMLSIRDAADHRLLPDGQDGIILAYQDRETGKWYAKWHPMIGGIRKALARNGVFVQSQIVCEADEWEWREGYDPWIVHNPAKLGTKRGKWIGAYAIFRRDGLAGPVLHQEVMDLHQIEAAHGVSKNGAGLLWESFKDQAWIKTVIRRGVKSVPILTPDVEGVVRSDDRYVDMEAVERAIEDAKSGGNDQGRSYDPLEDPSEDEVAARHIEGASTSGEADGNTIEAAAQSD
jgi:recombination protein RecT